MVLTFESVDESESVTIQMEAIEEYVLLVLSVCFFHEHPQVIFFWTQLEAIVATDAKLGCEFRCRVCGNLI